MRKALLLFAVVPVVLALATQPAVAMPPTTTVVNYHYDLTGFGRSCEGFDILFTADAVQRWTDFYDSSGQVTLSTVHFTFTGTLYNSADTTKTIPYQGGGYWTYDAQYVWDLSQYRMFALIDGRPVPLLVGLEKYTYDPFEVVSHMNGRFLPVICDALS